MQPTPVSNVAGAHCAEHEGAQATAACGRCGNFVCPLCLDPLADHDDWCEPCRERAGGNKMAWEREQGGAMARWWQTTKDVLFSPGATIERTRPGSLGKALLYNAITAVLIGSVFTALGVCAIGGLTALGGLDELSADPALREIGTPGVIALMMVIFLLSPILMPLWTVFVVGLRGAVYYLAIQLAGGGGEAKVPFWTVSYLGAMNLSLIPLQLIQQIPIIGPIIVLLGHLAVEIWYAIQLTNAAERYHGLSQGRAAFAGWSFFLLMSLLLTTCCCGGVLLGASGAL